MAGDEKGYGVLRKGGADGAIGSRADGLGNFRIGSAFAVGNGARYVPHGALKCRSEDTDGKRKCSSLAREIRADLLVGAFLEGCSLVRARAGENPRDGAVRLDGVETNRRHPSFRACI